PAVAAEVEVVPLFGGDDAEVLPLRLGALARAARDGRLQLVRRAEPLVAVLDPDGQADRVLHAVAAPGAAHARLHRAQRLAVGVARLEAGVDELAPDGGELLEACAEHVDALGAGDLGVEPVLAGDLADGHQSGGSDLAAGDAWNDRIGPVALDVGHVAVVGVLQRPVLRLEHVLVPGRGENGGHGGLADLAPAPAPVLRQQRVEGLVRVEANQRVELLATVREVLAEVVADRHARPLQLGPQEIRDQRDAGAAGGSGLGAALHRADGGQLLVADRAADLPLADVVAGADLRRVGQGGDAQAGRPLAFARR